MRTAPTPELFRAFPELRERLAWTGLAQATQVHSLERLRSFLRSDSLWVKRDDETSGIYGGSRARKLEFLFGDVLRSGRVRLLSGGRAGSSESLAIATFAQHFQLQAILAVRGPANAPHVLRTLALQKHMGAQIFHVDSGPKALWQLLHASLRGGTGKGSHRRPYVAWPGKLRAFGTLGYVNAAYELRRQINIGLLPEPATIYVGVGTAAMLAGLALGLELAGIGSRLVGVQSPESKNASPQAAFRAAVRLLRSRAQNFPAINGIVPVEVHRYRKRPPHATDAQQALGLVRDLEGLDLGTTAAHTMARLLDDVRAGHVRGPVLFWNTHAGKLLRDFTADGHRGRPGQLPESIGSL
jgi:D-cysteine desulfhydrase